LDPAAPSFSRNTVGISCDLFGQKGMILLSNVSCSSEQMKHTIEHIERWRCWRTPGGAAKLAASIIQPWKDFLSYAGVIGIFFKSHLVPCSARLL
jgi:hypothetical protein